MSNGDGERPGALGPEARGSEVVEFRLPDKPFAVLFLALLPGGNAIISFPVADEATARFLASKAEDKIREYYARQQSLVQPPY